MIRYLSVIVFDHIVCLKYIHISINIQLDWYTGEISILISQYTQRFPFSSWMFAVSIAFVFVKPHIGNFTPPIPKKMSRVIFFLRQSFRHCYGLDCTMNNSQIHKFILILSYTSKRPVFLWQLCMQATWNSIFCDSTGPPPIPKKMSRVIFFFRQSFRLRLITILIT